MLASLRPTRRKAGRSPHVVHSRCRVARGQPAGQGPDRKRGGPSPRKFRPTESRRLAAGLRPGWG
eukprot:5041282-Alexandrium_andersonii.AAC.1